MLNKKTYIRLLALVMALMMTVAVFAGCNNQEAIDEANANAQAAQNAADEAKKAADSLAQAAKDLADQLAAAQDKINEQDQAIKDAQDAADKAQSGVDDYHDPSKVTTAKPVETTASIAKDPYEGATKDADLKAFTDLKNDYLVIKRDWYTPANYAELNKIFEDASFEIYRTLDGTGLEQIINDAATKAAAIANIATDAAAVQAKITAFGDVATQVFTESDPLVTAAREAFDAWVNKYAACFFLKNGYSNFQYDDKGNIVTADVVYVAGTDKVDFIIDADIVEFAKKVTAAAVGANVIDINTNNLLYAEAKLEALYGAAKEAIMEAMKVELIVNGKTDAEAKAIVEVLFDDEATQVNLTTAIKNYEAVKAIVYKYKAEGEVSYADCKENGKIIEDAYDLYKIFMNANNNVDAPIVGAAGEDLLTGQQFVKLYVMTLYTGELREYQNDVKDYLYNEIVPFFLNAGNKSNIDTETGWNDFLSFSDAYSVVYNNDDAKEVVKLASNGYTFAVEFDHIDVYDANGNVIAANKVTADGVKIQNAFNTIAANTAAKIFAVNFVDDFKGTSLEDAFVEIDKYVVEAVADLAQSYYQNVVAYYIEAQLRAYDDKLEAEYVYATDKTVGDKRIDAYYRAYDNTFYNNAHKVIQLAINNVNTFKVATYDALDTIADEEKGIENISDQSMFTVTWKDRVYQADSVVLYKGDDKTGYNSAMKTVLEYFAAYMEDVATDLYTKDNDLKDAKAFHELKVDLAEKLDTITGIYEVDGTKFKTTTKASLLITQYGKNIADIQDKKLDDIQTSIYTAIAGVRDTGRNAIMAVEYMNYDDATVLYDVQQLRATNKDGKDLYYTAAKAITKDAKTSGTENKALYVYIDRDVVAQTEMYNLFADGANAVLNAFADIVRAQISTNVTTAIELYKKNYDFTGMDHIDQGGVYLEKDMQEYTDYLNSLTALSSVAFKATNFRLVDSKITAADFAALVAAGYTQYDVVDAKANVVDYRFHVTGFNATVDQITGVGASYENGWYDVLTKNALKDYFALTSSKAYKGLEDVRELAYLKDNVLNGTVATNGIDAMPVVLASFKGAVDKTGALVAAPTAKYDIFDGKGEQVCIYDPNTLRTALYLERLGQTYDAICAKIEAITILSVHADDDVALEDALAAAKTKIKGIVDASKVVTKVAVEIDDKGTPDDKTDDVVTKWGFAYDESDDMSLAMTYVRYYLVGQYEWVVYQNNID